MIRIPTIGEFLVENLDLHPEQWATEPVTLGWKYRNEAEDWTITRMVGLYGSTTLFNAASLTPVEKKHVDRAIDRLIDLRSDQRRAAAVRKYLTPKEPTPSPKRCSRAR